MATSLSVGDGDGDERGYVSLEGGPDDTSPSKFLPGLGKMNSNSNAMESMVFEESESLAWKSHHLKRFLTDRLSDSCIKSSRRTTIRPFDPESERLPDNKFVVAMRRDSKTDQVEATVKRLVRLASGQAYVLIPESNNPVHAPLPLEDLGEFSVYIFAVVMAAVTAV